MFVLIASVSAVLVATAAARSEVEFGLCKELAVGSITPLNLLQDLVPADVKVLSMTEQGFVFPGSDDLGNLLIRSLECDYIEVDGMNPGTPKKHIAHVGTPFDTSDFPASPYAAEGTTNGADFNNYVFAYLTDSQEYYDAMKEANIVGAELATIAYEDSSPGGDCLLERTVVVEQTTTNGGDYGYTAVATAFPDPACAPRNVPYIANWWSVDDEEVSILSNLIPGQAAVFFNLSETTITLEATGDGLMNLFGGNSTTADSFGLGGYIPETEESLDMIIDQVGSLKDPSDGDVAMADGDTILLGAQTRPGSFWMSYATADDVPDGCLVEAGTKVDDACCTSDEEQFLRVDFTSNTCAIMQGFLPDPTLGLVNYLGCEDGIEIYGEGCFAGGENGGIVPANVPFEGSNVTKVADCGTDGGCNFSVRGDGCWKIRNTNDLPGYGDQPGETFIWLNEPSCKLADEDLDEKKPGVPGDESAAEGAPTAAFKIVWMTCVLAIGIF